MDLLSNLSGNRSNRTFGAQEEIPSSESIPKDKQTVKRIFKLAGTSFTTYPFETLTVKQRVNLVLDSLGSRTQPHTDKTAIAVFDENYKHIAYIPREQAKHIYPLLDNGSLTLEAHIHEIRGGGDYNWGVDIHVRFIEL